MVIGGIDPSSDYIGLAELDAEPGARPEQRPPLVTLASVRAGKRGHDVTLRSTLACLELRAASTYAIERSPPSGTKKRAQAAIGDAIGWYGGLVAGGLIMGGHGVQRVHVSSWRTSMLRYAAAWGARVPHPKHERDTVRKRRNQAKAERMRDGSIQIRRPCGHVATCQLPSMVQAVLESSCPDCSGARPSLDMRTRWKRAACRFVAQLWPDPYAALVADARSRARTERPDWELAGVPDACEAVGIACSLLR